MLGGTSRRIAAKGTKSLGRRSVRSRASNNSSSFRREKSSSQSVEEARHKKPKHHGSHHHHHHPSIHQSGIHKQSRHITTNKSLTYPPDKSLEVVPAATVAGEPSIKNIRIPYPKEIVEYLDKHVVGQEAAKKTLAVSVYQHYRRLLYNMELREKVDAALFQAYSNPRNSLSKMKSDSFLVGSSSGRSQWSQDLHDFGKKRSSAKHVEGDLGRKFHKGSAEFLNDITLNPPLLDKSNVVLVGPSGSGKTYLTQKLANILDVPFSLADCTTLTQSGYVGEDADSVIQKLFQAAEGDIEKTQRGIVFLDEFDKIATSFDPVHSSNGMRDVSGKGVQQALLKIVEGTICRIKNPFLQGSKVDIDTSGILFIASGAFNNLDKVIAKRLEHRTVGFGAATSSHVEDLMNKDEQIAAKKRDELLAQVEQGDLIGFGMIPEVVGRFPIVCAFHSLDEKDFIKVMTEPQNSLLEQAQRQFSLDGIRLEVTEEALHAMATLAAKSKTGARSLRSIFEKVLLQAKFDSPGKQIDAIVIDKATVESQGRNFTTVKKDDNDAQKDNLS